MHKLKLFLVSTAFMLSNSSLVNALTLEADDIFINHPLDIHTETTQSPALRSPHAYQIAATWWLPDIQNHFNARSNQDKDSSNTKPSCQTYGYVSSCSFPQISTGAIRPHQGLTCQRGCICPSEYQYTTANCDRTKGWQIGSSLCQGKSNQCNTIPCPTGFTAGTTDCSAQSRPSGWSFSSNGWSGGQTCGKCTALSCNPGYSTGLSSCAAQAHPEGWNYTSDSSRPFAGNSACGKCTAKTCPSGYTSGIETCSGDGWSYGSSSYAGNTICGKCSAKSCATGYTSGLQNCSALPEAWYWNYTSSGKSGDAICGKCTEKTCAEKNALCTGKTVNLDYYYSNRNLRCLMP